MVYLLYTVDDKYIGMYFGRLYIKCLNIYCLKFQDKKQRYFWKCKYREGLWKKHPVDFLTLGVLTGESDKEIIQDGELFFIEDDENEES